MHPQLTQHGNGLRNALTDAGQAAILFVDRL
jgi:hypothetical protein